MCWRKKTKEVEVGKRELTELEAAILNIRSYARKRHDKRFTGEVKGWFKYEVQPECLEGDYFLPTGITPVKVRDEKSDTAIRIRLDWTGNINSYSVYSNDGLLVSDCFTEDEKMAVDSYIEKIVKAIGNEARLAKTILKPAIKSYVEKLLVAASGDVAKE